jgi:hypothetical protein
LAIYVARRQNREQFDKFFGLLTPANQVWAKNATALVVVASRTRFEYNDKPSITHAFDAGSTDTPTFRPTAESFMPGGFLQRTMPGRNPFASRAEAPQAQLAFLLGRVQVLGAVMKGYSRFFPNCPASSKG